MVPPRQMALCAGVLVGGLLLFVSGPASFGKGKVPHKPPPRPDLVVKHAHLRVNDYVLRRPDQAVSFEYTLVNEGRGPAPESESKLVLICVPGCQRNRRLVLPPVKDVVRPGKHKFVQVSGQADFSQVPFGRYDLEVCADYNHKIAESHEDNNCGPVAGFLSVVPHEFTGKVNGSGEFNFQPGVTESWEGDVTFTVNPGNAGYLNYQYLPIELTITYRTSGTDANGCTYSGSATYGGGGAVFARFWLLDYVDRYDGEGFVSPAVGGYDVSVDCPDGGTSTQRGPQYAWLRTSGGPHPISPQFGFERLTGGYSYAGVTGPVSWNWDLAAVP